MYHVAGYNSCMGIAADRSVIVCLGFFAWTFLALAIGFRGQQSRVAQDKRSPEELAFCTLLGLRVSVIMIAIVLIMGCPLELYAGGIFDTGNQRQGMTSEYWPLYCLAVFTGVAIGGTILYFSEPDDFIINWDRRTYRHTYGWSFSQQVKTGSLDDDFAGVYVRCAAMNSRYEIGLVWKRERKWKLLGAFNRSGKADRFAEETTRALGLPLVAPPSYLKSSTDTRNGLG